MINGYSDLRSRNIPQFINMVTKRFPQIHIQPLSACMASIPMLAQIWVDVLGRHWLPKVTAMSIAHDLAKNIAKDTLPITLVAKCDSKPLGMVTLCKKDGLDSKLTPWLSDFVVAERHQNQGVGQALMDAALQHSVALGYKKLHLFTFDEKLLGYYQRSGWKTIDKDVYKNHPVTVMRIDLHRIS